MTAFVQCIDGAYGKTYAFMLTEGAVISTSEIATGASHPAGGIAAV